MSPTRRSTGFVACLVALVAAGLIAPGAAPGHPFDATYYSCRAAVRADAEGLHVLVVVEVPTAFILEEFLTLYGDPTQLDEEADEIFRNRRFESLIGDLRLRVNRRPAQGTWRPVDSEANGRGTETFFVYLLEHVFEDPKALAAEDVLDLRLDMEVFSRELIYLSADAQADGPWRLAESSAEPILAAAEEELIDPETGRWTVDPRLRRLKIRFEKIAESNDVPPPDPSTPSPQGDSP